jgi:hypothetical protein
VCVHVYPGLLLIHTVTHSGMLPTELGQLVMLVKLNLEENGLCGELVALGWRLTTSSHLQRACMLWNGQASHTTQAVAALAESVFHPPETHSESQSFASYLSTMVLYALSAWGWPPLCNKKWGCQGPIPPEISKLERLERVNLSGNFLNGELPAELSSVDDCSHHAS